VKLIESWRDYARAVVEVDDLDPTYGFFNKARQVKGDEWANRAVLHLLLFYDLGGAVRAANDTWEETFWEYVANHYNEAKRGTERRHSRGDLGRRYIANLRERGTPMVIMERLHAPVYTEMYRKIEKEFAGCGFGPYFIWKIMDLQDRCLGRRVTLNMQEAIRYMPDQPRKCAAETFPTHTLEGAIRNVVEAVSDLAAPGDPNRGCGYSEAETILCTIHSFFKTKTYNIGDDITKRHKQLAEFPYLARLLPPQQDWSQYVRSTAVDPATLSADLT